MSGVAAAERKAHETYVGKDDTVRRVDIERLGF